MVCLCLATSSLKLNIVSSNCLGKHTVGDLTELLNGKRLKTSHINHQKCQSSCSISDSFRNSFTSHFAHIFTEMAPPVKSTVKQPQRQFLQPHVKKLFFKKQKERWSGHTHPRQFILFSCYPSLRKSKDET